MPSDNGIGDSDNLLNGLCINDFMECFIVINKVSRNLKPESPPGALNLEAERHTLKPF